MAFWRICRVLADGTGTAPSSSSMRLRSIVRHVENLSVQSAQNQNRLHAAHGSTSTPGCVVQDLKRSVASLEQRIHKLRREAMTLVRQDDLLRRRYELLVGIPGIAQVSAMQLLAELSTLPSDLTVREWVAHSGLDPAHEISGSSVRKASRISRAGNRHLRRAVYMPELVASRCDPHARAFFESLLARNKAHLQALVAVARKLLHAIYGMIRSTTNMRAPNCSRKFVRRNTLLSLGADSNCSRERTRQTQSLRTTARTQKEFLLGPANDFESRTGNEAVSLELL